MIPESPSPGTPPPTTWVERRDQAEKLCAELVAKPLSDDDCKKIQAFAVDSKWEVRKIIAEALPTLPELLFRDLGPKLSADSNAFVSTAARRSSERRLPAANLGASAPGKIQQAVDRIAVKYGQAVANESMKLAHQITERHLRSAVHDIKNILTSLSIDIDKFHNLTATQQKKLMRVKQGTDYLRHLSDMMAQYSAEPEIKYQPEVLSEIVAEAHSSAVEQIERGGRSVEGVTFTHEVPEGLTVSVSRFHIAMVLTNLIKNGIEAHAVSPREMRPGGVHVKVEIVAEEVAITVSDKGRGIAVDDLTQLREFIPGASSKRKTGNNLGSGTGYGLPTIHRSPRRQHGY